MKKIFRGVALKQNRIEPSKINIEANIKTKMPIFYDEDDSEQQQKPQPKQPIKTSVPPTNQPPVKQQPPPQQPVQQNDPLKLYDDYWKTLPTKHNLIDASDVKKLCAANTTSKSNLSKAWKLCNISQKGALTKGEFFVFMNLVNSNNIPDTLSKQMRQIVAKIEQTCGYKKSSNQQKTEVKIQQKPKEKPITKSDVFEKFGDESLFEKRPSKLQPSTFKALNNDINNNHSFGPKAQTIVNLAKSQQIQIKTVASNNQQMNSSLQSVEQYLGVIQQNFIAQEQQIAILKQTQGSLNDRLNSVCLAMKDIITKQTQCINGLMQNINDQSQINVDRLRILEKYVQEMSSITDSNINNAKSTNIHIQKQQTIIHNQVKKQAQGLKQKLPVGVNSRVTQKLQHSRHKEQEQITNRPSLQRNPFDDHQPDQEPSHIRQQQPIRQPAKQSSSQEISQPQHIDIENLTPQQKIKIKQMQLIQMVNYITPIKQQQYPGVVQRITSMTQQQMNTLYAKLYEMYLKKQEEKQEEFPNADQFNTSQFIDQNTLKKHNNQQQQGFF